MVSYEASSVSRASPEKVWEAWIDVASWSKYEHIEFARLDGEFRPDAIITSKAKGFPRSTLTITRVDPPRLWVNESRSPGVRMTFEHVIEPGEAGTELTERVLIRGPLARPVGILMGRKLKALFATSVAHVARRAEHGAEPAPGPPVEN
ncbi:MAG: SRPBCC family protein [Actinomycetota bacterium]|nr:SRPBCC family protein [Actinomycetota bacterium]